MHLRNSGFVYSIAMLAVTFWVVAKTTYAEPLANPGEMSNAKVAQQLANPNSPLAILAMKNQYNFYQGSLPGANDQGNYDFVFQPAFPFKLENGHRVFFRPTFTLISDKPVFNNNKRVFEGRSGLGDIGVDLTYGTTYKSGFLWAMGASTSMPAATDRGLGTQQWLLGPRIGAGWLKDWGVLAVFPMHQWNVAGWNNSNTSLTTIQPIATLLLGGGWAVGSTPTITYEWTQSQWTVPIDLMVSKTVKIGKTPFRLGLSIDYYVEQPNRFGPKVMVGFNITPVVHNILAQWLQ